MFNKKIMMIAIIITSLLAVSAVSATDSMENQVSTVNETFNSIEPVANDDAQNGILTMDDDDIDDDSDDNWDDDEDYWDDEEDYEDDYPYDEDDPSDYTYDERIDAKLKIEITDYPKSYGDDEVKIRLATEEDDVGLANVELNVMAYAFNEDLKASSDEKLASPDCDSKLATTGDINDFATVTTNSKGIAVYKVPSKFTGQFYMMIGFKTDEGLLMNGNVTYNGENRPATLNTTVRIIDGANAKSCSIYKIPVTMPKSTALLKLTKSGTYYQGVVLKVLMTTPKNEAMANQKVKITFSNGKSATVTTNAKGIATYTVPFAPGTYWASASAVSAKSTPAKGTGIKITKASAVLTPYKLSTTYASGKQFQVKVLNAKTKKVMPNVRLTLKVYTGKKCKTVTVTSDAKGIARYSASALSLGTHKIVASVKDKKFVTATQKASSVKVSKAALRIVAPEVTNSPNTGTFKATVQNKESGKGMAGVKVSVKVYTGNGYKTYNVKTNSAGVASISTASLAKGVHNVVVNVGKTAKYTGATAKSSIKIEQKQVETHITGKNSMRKVIGGALSSLSATFNLLDSNGNQVNGKLEVQLKLSNGVKCSGVETGDANTEFTISPTSHSSDYSSMVVVVTYAGDSTHKPCTAEFRV